MVSMGFVNGSPTRCERLVDSVLEKEWKSLRTSHIKMRRAHRGAKVKVKAKMVNLAEDYKSKKGKAVEARSSLEK